MEIPRKRDFSSERDCSRSDGPAQMKEGGGKKEAPPLTWGTNTARAGAAAVEAAIPFLSPGAMRLRGERAPPTECRRVTRLGPYKYAGGEGDRRRRRCARGWCRAGGYGC